LDAGTPKVSVGGRPLGADRKPMALRPGSLGAVVVTKIKSEQYCGFDLDF
jgi:hypothetical protein